MVTLMVAYHIYICSLVLWRGAGLEKCTVDCKVVYNFFKKSCSFVWTAGYGQHRKSAN